MLYYLDISIVNTHVCEIRAYHDGLSLPFWWWPQPLAFITLKPRQNGRHFADDIFKCIFLDKSVWIAIYISLKIVPNGSINYILASVQIMAWRRPGDKPLSEPVMVRLPTQICVTRPWWVIRVCSGLPTDVNTYSVGKLVHLCLVLTVSVCHLAKMCLKLKISWIKFAF